MTRSFFRQQAIEEQRDRLRGEVVVAQPLSFAVITVAVLLLVVIAGVYLFYGTYARRATVMGYLVPDNEGEGICACGI
jgi:membrane fusion protein